MSKPPTVPPRPADAQTPPPQEVVVVTTPPPPRRRRRVLKVLAWTAGVLLVLGLAVFFAGPPLGSAIARKQIIASLEESFDGTAHVDRVSFSWFKPTTLEGLRMTNRAGAEMLSVKRAVVRFPLRGAVTGNYNLDVVVDSPFAAMNELKAAMKEKPPREKKKEKYEKPDKDFPNVHATVKVTNTRVTFGDAAFALADASFAMDLAGQGGQVRTLLTDATLTGKDNTTREPRLEANADFTWVDRVLTLKSAFARTSFAHLNVDGRIAFTDAGVEFRGLSGQGAYVPDKLGAALKPVLPGTLAGSDERKLAFKLDGRAGNTDVLSILRGATGDGSLSIAPYTGPKIALAGDVSFALADGRATTKSALDFNGGKASLDAVADLRGQPDAVSSVKVEMKQVEVNSALSGLLSYLHPIFAMAEGRLEGMIQGRIDFDLDARYAAPLPEQFTMKMALTPVNAQGRMSVRDLKVAGTPFLGELLGFLNVDATREVELDSIEFSIRDGRLSYSKPVPMRIGGIATQWTGTIGLDRTLDLQWEIPVSDKLAERFPIAKSLKSIRVPVGGTALRPQIKVDGIISGLGANGARDVIEQKGEELVDELLKGRDAKRTLEKADKLWDEGKKEDALNQYRRMKDDYSRTRAYRDNQERILERLK